MKITSARLSGTALALAAFCFFESAGAVPLLCQEASSAHTSMDATQVAACLGADIHDTQDQALSVDARWNEITIATAFVSSEQVDRWFVSFLNPWLASGDWQFTKVRDRDGRLSHIKLYGQSANVPEPGTLALLGIGLVGLGIASRRRRLGSRVR